MVAASFVALAPLGLSGQSARQSAPANAAQTSVADRSAVLAVVARLFDGMRAGDSAVVHSVFHPQAVLMTAAVRDGRPVLESDSLSAFLTAVGTPHAEPWDERTHDAVVQVDGPLAAVWVAYDFYLGEKLSHCGVDALQLLRSAEGWRIIALTDTRRKERCGGSARPSR